MSSSRNAGPKKIEVIKVIRQLTNLGLVEAKTMAETAGGKVLTAVGKDAAGCQGQARSRRRCRRRCLSFRKHANKKRARPLRTARLFNRCSGRRLINRCGGYCILNWRTTMTTLP